MEENTQKNIVGINVLYMYTSIINGQEKIMVDAIGTPLIYLNIKALIGEDLPKKMQLWSNSSGLCMTLKMFTLTKIVDRIEPMKTELTM